MMPSLCSPRLSFALAAVTTTACATPIPQPPPDDNLDVGSIGLPETWPTSGDALPLRGDPGAAPPGSTLRLTNLDRADAPVVAVVADDGSFAASVPATREDVIRFQIITPDGARPEPVDVRVTSEFAFEVAPTLSCFEVARQRDFGATGVGNFALDTFVLDNACSAPATVDQAAFRTGPAAFTFSGDFPPAVDAGEAASFDIVFGPTGIGPFEQIVLVTVTIDGDRIRYPVSVYGRGE
ncbi:MAG: hypothetical protein AAF928_11870 [Myxococcota bacterium]